MLTNEQLMDALRKAGLAHGDMIVTELKDGNYIDEPSYRARALVETILAMERLRWIKIENAFRSQIATMTIERNGLSTAGGNGDHYQHGKQATMSGHYICDRCGYDGEHAEWCVCLRPIPEQWRGHRTALEMEELKRHNAAIAVSPPVSEPTEAMLNAARDWSRAEYGKPIGNDAATGCWKAMHAAFPQEEDRMLPSIIDELKKASPETLAKVSRVLIEQRQPTTLERLQAEARDDA